MNETCGQEMNPYIEIYALIFKKLYYIIYSQRVYDTHDTSFYEESDICPYMNINVKIVVRYMSFL